LNTGIVHQDIGAAEPMPHRGLQTAQVFDAADIRLKSHHIGCFASRQGGNLFSGVFESRLPKVGNADAKSELGESLRSGKTNAGSAASDDGDGSGLECGSCHGGFFLLEAG
jgi:hypothetical protein